MAVIEGSYAKEIEDGISILKKMSKKDFSNDEKMFDLLEILHDTIRHEIHGVLVVNEEEKQIRKQIKSVIVDIIPIIEVKLNLLEKTKKKDKLVKYLELYEKFYAIASFRSFRHFCLFMDWDKEVDDKVWINSQHSMQGALYYTNKMILDDDVNFIRISCPTGYGKTYIQNLTCAFYFGYNPSIRILKVTESDELVTEGVSNIKKIIRNRLYRMVFPLFDKDSDEDVFEKNDKYSFTLDLGKNGRSFLCVTRQSMANGVRADVIMLDDLSKGYSESANAKVHEQIVNTYKTIWRKRIDNAKKRKIIMAGTMWNDFDLLNIMRKETEEEQEVLPSRLRYTDVSEDGKKVFIGVPALDYDTDESTLPEKYSTQEFRNERNSLPPELWSAMAQQRPLPPKDLSFDWTQLQQYDYPNFPLNEDGTSKFDNYCYGVVDPARKGKNYVSMPVFTHAIDGKYYLMDALYEKKGMDEMYDKIVNKCIQHNIIKLYVENNTDTSLKKVLLGKMEELQWFSTEIIEIYSTANKEQRIKDMQGTTKKNIVFPAKSTFDTRNPLHLFMKHIIQFNFDRPNEYDDSIDSVTLFTQKHIFSNSSFSKISIPNRRISQE